MQEGVTAFAFLAGDQGPSWTAVFALFILYWLSYIPRLWIGTFKRDVETDTVKETRAHRTNSKARDGLLLLTTGVIIAFAARATESAITVLSWVFFGFWVLIVLLNYFIDPKLVITLLELTAISLIFAIIVIAFATAHGRVSP